MGTPLSSTKIADAVSARLADALRKVKRSSRVERTSHAPPVAAAGPAASSARDVSDRLKELTQAARKAARTTDRHAVHRADAPTDAFNERLATLVNRRNGTGKAAVVQEAPAEAPAPGSGPVGTGDHVVNQGECISSIAKETGHFWETIWTDPQNSELREVRTNPNVLLPGDRVMIPPIESKHESGATEMRHRFVRLGEPAKVCLAVRENGQPRGNQPYTLEVEGATQTGTTDPDGRLTVAIPGNARRGRLTVGAPGATRVYALRFGRLDPVESVTGLQARLANLGFACGSIDGKWGERTRAALKAFQARHGLEPTGVADGKTRACLKEQHGS